MEKNRKNLRDAGICLIILGVFHVFMLIATVVGGMVDGSISKALAEVTPDITVAVKIGLGVSAALAAFIVFADVLIGIKALKVSDKPCADKGYIIAARIFFFISVFAIISNFISIFRGGTPVVDASLNSASAVLDVIIYAWFIQNAEEVRKDFLNGVQ